MNGAGVDGQAFFPIESLPAVVAHEAGVVFVLPQMALEKYAFKLIKIEDIKNSTDRWRETDTITYGQTDRQTDKLDNIKTETYWRPTYRQDIGRHIDRKKDRSINRWTG
jgi:uncharacterized phage-like protein YoqJ